MAEWYLLQGETRVGPVSAGKLKSLATRGTLRPTDLVWKEGLKDWVEACTVTNLFPPGPPPAPPTHQPAAGLSSIAIPQTSPSPSTVALASAEGATPAKESFGVWYDRSFGHLAMPLQVLMWLAYGYVWIPIKYLASSGTPAFESKAGSSLWMAWFFVPYFAFAGWLHAAIRSSYRRYYMWAAVYSIPLILVGQAGDTEPSDEAVTFAIFAWFVGMFHAAGKRKEVNLRIKYANAQQSGDRELEQRIRREYSVTPAAESNDATEAAELSIPNETSMTMRVLFFIGSAVGAWVIERLLERSGVMDALGI